MPQQGLSELRNHRSSSVPPQYATFVPLLCLIMTPFVCYLLTCSQPLHSVHSLCCNNISTHGSSLQPLTPPGHSDIQYMNFIS
ncbi:hypothetical protein BDZ91DRAFT_111543 [Kalaharituber pfeilii]|nr:hypothetical protein BDZ91DRAFT_111543 [Kalaharituber pfeilii]